MSLVLSRVQEVHRPRAGSGHHDIGAAPQLHEVTPTPLTPPHTS